jgi:hypothetical protein
MVALPMMVGFTTSLTVMVTFTDFEILEDFAAGRRSLSRGVGRWAAHVMVVLSMMVGSTTSVMVTFTDFEIVNKFSAGGSLTNGVSNDRCDGSNSKNECDGKFDLNHVEL